jgi:hypothetical protein
VIVIFGALAALQILVGGEPAFEVNAAHDSPSTHRAP